nr:tRNA (guanine-N(7)-)-methyltransferase-like [Nerophis lumbriciformis]
MPVLVDAGCGTGESTYALAREHRESWVVGIDRSAHRLSRPKGANGQGERPDNALMIQADLVGWLQLAALGRWQFDGIYLLYPNPYPKPKHLQRRWHAHGIFPTLLALTSAVELRTNWRIYADELVQALRRYELDSTVARYKPDRPVSPFERKYQASGHELFKVTADTRAVTMIDIACKMSFRPPG